MCFFRIRAKANMKDERSPIRASKLGSITTMAVACCEKHSGNIVVLNFLPK